MGAPVGRRCRRGWVGSRIVRSSCTASTSSSFRRRKETAGPPSGEINLNNYWSRLQAAI